MLTKTLPGPVTVADGGRFMPRKVHLRFERGVVFINPI